MAGADQMRKETANPITKWVRHASRSEAAASIAASIISMASVFISTAKDNWWIFCITSAVVLIGFGGWWVFGREGRPTVNTERPLQLFLSMQMSDLTNDEYVFVHQSIMRIIHDLRKRHGVYFYNETILRQEEFEPRTFDPRTYLAEIDSADLFVAVVTKKVVSSVYFEAGYALAKGKRCVYFFANEHLLPLVMRHVAFKHENVRACQKTDLSDVASILKNIDWRIKKTSGPSSN